MKMCFKSSVLQQTISRYVVGGRAMCNSNKMYHAKKVADFDVCGLYPSAMYFMDGFLKGLPKVLNDTFYGFLKSQDGYFIRTQVVKLNKDLDFPPTSKTNEDGVRDFIHDMENGIYIYIYIY